MARSSVLLSIRPEFADKVLDGVKNVELRRVRPRLKGGDWVFVYASSPIKRLVGFFEVDEVVKEEPQSLWNKVGSTAGISRDRYDLYFSGVREACAIYIRRTWRFGNPLELKVLKRGTTPFSAPQSFRYLHMDEAKHLLRLGWKRNGTQAAESS
ncbi:MAG: ASCH domain-containing protein [Candidatus Sumerlaeota bacterium]|nr:ASCH domain-containing protein [Candidatus Sumerlaeota bacterium]